MTVQEMIEKLDTLTVDEQLRLMEALTQQLQRSVRQVSGHPMLGFFGVNRDVPREEIKEIIANALIEKYK